MLNKIFLTLILSFIPYLSSFAASDESLASNALVISKDVTLPERSDYKNIVVLSGKVDLFGKVENLVVLGGVIRIHEKAEVKNKMIVLGGTVEQLAGSKIPTPLKETFGERWDGFSKNWIDKWKHRFDDPNDDEEETSVDSKKWNFFSFPLLLAIPLAILIVLFGFAMIFFTIAPRFSDTADEHLKRDPFISLIWGSLGYLFITPFIAVLTISIVGIPLVPLVIFFAVLLVLTGFFAACRALGGLVLARFGLHVRALDTLLGIIILYGLIFMPFIGKLLVFFIIIAGTGAVLRSLLGGGNTRFDFWKSKRVYDI